VADDIAAVVHAVGEIDVQESRGFEHDLVALGRPAMGMRGRILCCSVCLHLDDASGAELSAGSGCKDEPEQAWRHLDGVGPQQLPVVLTKKAELETWLWRQLVQLARRSLSAASWLS
jgi:hypothetical protein